MEMFLSSSSQFVLHLALISLVACSRGAFKFIPSLFSKKCILAGVVSTSFFFGPGQVLIPPSFAADEYFGDTSTSVGSINLNIFNSPEAQAKKRELAKQRAAMAQSAEKSSEKDLTEFGQVLELIPSWKYYKIISQEYSKRSSGYSGEVNLLAPLL